jgi:hypothetical protein
MLAVITLAAVKIALKLLAPRAGSTIGHMQTVARVALPIVEEISTHNHTNDEKYDKAVGMTKAKIGRKVIVGELASDHVIESGVQLAYSIFKATRK